MAFSTRTQLEEAAEAEYRDLLMAAYREYERSVDGCGRRLARPCMRYGSCAEGLSDPARLAGHEQH